MRIINAVLAVAVASFAAVACGVSPQEAGEGETSSAATAAAKVGVNGNCSTDSSCASGLVCDLHCPSIPGRLHCEIAGGTCQPIATDTAATLNGKTFTSANGVESITFTSTKAFSKTVGCTPSSSGIKCNHIVLTTGTYASSGTMIKLVSSLGGVDTLTVEPHPYDGLVDTTGQIELYPVAN